MKDKIFGVLQRVGRSFMLPIALLPIAGLLLGIGSSFTNPTTLEAYHLTNVIKEGGVLFTLLDIRSKTGSIHYGQAHGVSKIVLENITIDGLIQHLGTQIADKY